MEGQSVTGSLQSITDRGAKYNGNGLKIAVFVRFWAPTKPGRPGLRAYLSHSAVSGFG